LTLHASVQTVVLVAFLDANAVLATHDHKDFIGGMRVLKGSLKVDTFGYVKGARPSDMAPAKLQREAQVTLGVGDTASILSDVSHIHQVAAGDSGAVFLDIYTMYQNPGSCRFYDTSSAAPGARDLEAKPLIDIAIH